jgi:hypothetical protein
MYLYTEKCAQFLGKESRGLSLIVTGEVWLKMKDYYVW